jgi:hypothetical protein
VERVDASCSILQLPESLRYVKIHQEEQPLLMLHAILDINVQASDSRLTTVAS